MEDDAERCGAPTSKGGECQNPAESCPWHNVDETPPRQQTNLERTPELVDLVADRLSAGDTVSEACAEVDGISEEAYYRYRRRGRDDDSKGIFERFRKETARARRQAGKRDRAELKAAMRDAEDTRGWLKLHMNQYGDAYGDEETDMREGTEIVIHESESTYRDAIEN